MWVFAAGLVLVFLARARAAGRTPFEQFGLDLMRLFVRLGHGARWDRPAPVPPQGGAIVVANHSSLADPAFLLASCPRFIQFLQARECYEVPLLRPLFRRAGCIPVARDGNDVRAARVALRRLREGAVLGIFPDGEVAYDDAAADNEARLGVAFLALRGRVPVVPAYISGGRSTRSLLHAWFWPTRAVRVTYGEPLDLSASFGRRLDRALLEEVTEVVMARVSALRAAEPAAVVPLADYFRSELDQLPADFNPAASCAVGLLR